jgi:hypothetical protein
MLRRGAHAEKPAASGGRPSNPAIPVQYSGLREGVADGGAFDRHGRSKPLNKQSKISIREKVGAGPAVPLVNVTKT